MSAPSSPNPPPPAAPVDESARRAKIRRFALLLVVVVVLLAAFAVGYVLFFERVLRDPNAPPSAKGTNRRALLFELSFWGCIVLAFGVVLQRVMKRRGPMAEEER